MNPTAGLPGNNAPSDADGEPSGTGRALAFPSGSLVARAVADYLVAPPRTITVPDDYPSVFLAVHHARMGDAVFVREGHYQEHVVGGRDN